MTDSAFRTARDRARTQITGEILAAARAELAEVGAAALALRAVARRVGMAPSALYRYFPGREELLTALIIDAYNGLGEHAEAVAADVTDHDPTCRWLTVCHAVRDWARAHPHEFALIYGSPVPGYAAPEDTIGPATRLHRVLAAILNDAMDTGQLTPPQRPFPRLVRPAILEAFGTPPAPYEDIIERTLMAWTMLIGTVHFELSRHLGDPVADPDAYFTAAISTTVETVGLPQEFVVATDD